MNKKLNFFILYLNQSQRSIITMLMSSFRFACVNILSYVKSMQNFRVIRLPEEELLEGGMKISSPSLNRRVKEIQLGCFSHNKNLNGIEDVDEQIAGIHNGGLVCLCNRFSSQACLNFTSVTFQSAERVQVEAQIQSLNKAI